MYLLSNNKTYRRDEILKVIRPDEDPSTEEDETELQVQLSEDVSTELEDVSTELEDASTEPGSEPE